MLVIRRSLLSVSIAATFAFGSLAGSASAAGADSPTALSVSASAPQLLALRSEVFDPLHRQVAKRGFAGAADGRYAIVQLEFGEDATAARSRLERGGHTIVGFIPNNAYSVRLGARGLESIAGLDGVRWTGAYASEWKVDPAVAAVVAGSAEFRTDLDVDGFAGESAARIAAALRKFIPEAAVINVREHAFQPRLRVRVPSLKYQQAVTALSRVDGVAWVAPFAEPRISNDESIPSIQADSTTGNPIWDRDIIGTGQIVAVADTGLDRNESWFTALDRGTGVVTEITNAETPVPPAIASIFPDRKVFAYYVQPGATAYDGSSLSFHGTHVVGSVAGDRGATASPTDPAHDAGGDDGMAPNAQILFQDIGNEAGGNLSITDLPATLRQAVAAGARVHSNSWGNTSSFGAYLSNDAEADDTAWELEDLLVIFAAGNDGVPVVGSVSSPGNAKNVISVGAMGHGNSTLVASFSNQGPTDDNRIKPDIMAPGASIWSASGNNDNGATVQPGASRSLSGTSMAAPTVAGGAALARQYFVDGFYPRGQRTAADTVTPSGALMKAALLNGTAILGAYPTNTFGWGRIFLENTLYFNSAVGGGPGDTRRMRLWERENDAGLLAGQMHEYTLNAVGAGGDLRVTLTWFDPAGGPGSAITRVNNLDLEVSGPAGLLYRGNAFVGGVSSPNAGVPDDRNNVEQIRVVAPVAGAYTLRVRAIATPGNGREGSGRQGYALAASGAFGVPDAAANPAPTAVAISSNNTTGVAVGFTGSSTQGYQLYRADGTCAAPPGSFRLVAHAPGGPLLDTTTQGGSTYAYKVRGASNDIEGAASGCVSGVSNDDCTRRPAWDARSITRDFTNPSCSVSLDWAAAVSNCSLTPSVNYLVERDTSPYFTAPTQIGNPSSDNYLDAAVTSGQPYYYRITARDGANNATSPSLIVNATPVGPGGPAGAGYVDDVDDNTYMTMESPWRITNTRASNGTLSYHNAGDGLNYLANTCASLSTPPFIVPVGATLNYAARYNLEENWDGVVVEISTNGGASWSDLPPDGGYPGTLSATLDPPVNACRYPFTQGAFTGSSLTLFQEKTNSLAALAGRVVMIRWRFTSDSGAEEEGFYLDNVRISGTNPPVDPARIFGASFEELEGPTTCN